MANSLNLRKIRIWLLLGFLCYGFTAIALEVNSNNEKSTSMEFDLDQVKMNVIKTAENGVVNKETIFLFSQKDGIVSAEYSGGKISKGFLVGKFPSKNQLMFSYCQMQIDGTLDNGVSVCELSRNENGKITLTEHFEWKSRPGEFGTNIFQEL